MVTEPDLSKNHQLLLITAVRRMISGTEDPPVSEILQSNILFVISEIFRFTDTAEEIRIMKVILVNNFNQ